MIDPRRRALELLAAGQLPSMDPVDVETVPSDVPPTDPPTSDLDGGGRTVPQELTSGAPQTATARDYYADALRQKHEREFQGALGGVGSGIIQAFTGVGPSAEAIEQRKSYAEEPITTYLQKQKEADRARELDLQQARLQPKPGQRVKSTDPSSPESKRAQAIIGATLGDQYAPEEIAQMTEADVDSVLKYGSIKRGAEVTREGQVANTQRSQAQLEQQARIWAERKGLEWAKMSQQERLAALRESQRDEQRDTAETDRLRKEFMGNPVVRAYQEASIAKEKVERAAADPSAAGDLALIFGYMKTLDPGSTVREGEFANAQNAGGVDAKVMSIYNRVLNGERLTTAQRQDFIRSARTQFKAHETAYGKMKSYYDSLASPGRSERVTFPSSGNLDLSAPTAPVGGGQVQGGDARNLVQKVTKGGKIWRTYSDGTQTVEDE